MIQIIRKTDGKYAVWDYNLEDITYDGVTRAETTRLLLNHREVVMTPNDLGIIFAGLEKGKKPYGEATLTYDEARLLTRSIHGKLIKRFAHKDKTKNFDV